MLSLNQQYGVDFEALFAKQEGRCAICGTKQEELRKRLAVDHSHETGKARGLLCADCNSGLGFFKDDRERMRRGIAYLDDAETESMPVVPGGVLQRQGRVPSPSEVGLQGDVQGVHGVLCAQV
jgi:hypothetical protein